MDVSMGACRTEARVLGPQTEQEATLTMEAEAGATWPQARGSGSHRNGIDPEPPAGAWPCPQPGTGPVLARH